MNYKSIKKWLLRSVLALIVLSITSFIWMNYQVNRMWGAHTKIVDHRKFQVPQLKLAIINAHVLSESGEQMIPNQTVVIEQGKITFIGPRPSNLTGTHIIDAQGQYLIPGLIDSHVHLWQSPNDLLLYLANGVTHIRELNGSEEHLQWKKEIKQGRIGPDMFVASGRLNSNSPLKGWFDHWTAKITSVHDQEHAETVVQASYDKGYDAIKVYTFLDKEHFFAVEAAAKKIDMPLLGHIPISIGLENILNSDLKELAHTEELVKALNREFGGYNTPNVNEFLQFVENRSEDVANQLLENNIAVISTQWLMESFSKQKIELNSTLKKVELAYVNPGITEAIHPSIRVMGWLPEVNIYRLPDDYPSEELAGNRIYWETYAKANQILIKAMAKKGVDVLAGTDANIPVAVPGFSIHDELQSLTQAGMSPVQALISATAVPAQRMKIKSGKIAVNYQADLLLLNANPLEKIENTKTIESVITNGRLVNRKQIDEILSAVKEANDDSRTVDISEY